MSLFIPKRINVGYQDRQGTYTGRLAYIIYYDEKGKLRKEKSWQNWRDQKIDSEEFDNEPTEGFVLNKDVQRCNWSHFGSGRSYIRVYDPRGIEFEVTPENLIGILMESDCNKRQLIGEFVYAWRGTELLLLPCGSESFKEAKEHTKRQHQKVSARDLKPGCNYTTKDGDEVTYIGRFDWYGWKDCYSGKRTKNRWHIFWDGKRFDPIKNMNKLSFLNSEEPVQDYAELVEKLKKNVRAHEIVGFETTSAPPTDIIIDRYESKSFFKLQGDYIVSYHVRKSYYQVERYEIHSSIELNTITWKKGYYRSDRYCTIPHLPSKQTKDQILSFLKDAVEVDLVLASGDKHPLTSIRYL